MIAQLFIISFAVVVRGSVLYGDGGESVSSRSEDGLGNYHFNYDIVDPLGATNGRYEVGDAYGNKRGSYTLTDIDGRARRVDYVADEHGFRAVVQTNEPGTTSSKPADTLFSSSNVGTESGKPVLHEQPVVHAAPVPPPVPVVHHAPAVIQEAPAPKVYSTPYVNTATVIDTTPDVAPAFGVRRVSHATRLLLNNRFPALATRVEKPVVYRPLSHTTRLLPVASHRVVPEANLVYASPVSHSRIVLASPTYNDPVSLNHAVPGTHSVILPIRRPPVGRRISLARAVHNGDIHYGSRLL